MKSITALLSIAALLTAYPALIHAATLQLEYSTYLGGSGNDYGNRITLGPGGEAYVAGETVSSDFPNLNPYQASFGGGSWDIFVSKLSSSGSSLIYSTYLGGSGWDYGYGITLGTGGEAYITGYTGSADFPTLNPYQANFGGTNDAFVSSLSSSGSSLIYSTYFGGSDDDTGRGITLRTGGEAYVTGYTLSANFPTLNPYQASNSGSADVFVSSLSSSGSSLVSSTYLGGSGLDYGYGITLGTGGEAYVTGYTLSANFPTANPYQASRGGNQDVFISKLASSGSSLVSSTYLGGIGIDRGNGIELGTGGEAYVAGVTESADFPTLNPYQASLGGGTWDVFISKLASSGSSLVSSTYLGGSGSDYGWGFALGTGGEAYVTGVTGSADFPTLNP